MARKATTTSAATPPEGRTCGECRHSLRDVDGPNFNVHTRTYFMGKCMRGHGFGEKHKVFMEEKTWCKEWQK